MKEHIYIIVVLYNKKISEIRSLNNFLKLKEKADVNIIVSDNSVSDVKANNLFEYENIYKNKMIYIDNGYNIGLSKAYNKAIEMIEYNDYWIMLADDDTLFSTEYLNNVLHVIDEQKCKVISGIVRNDRGIMSPIRELKLFYNKSDYISVTNDYENIYCINSGLCVNSVIFERIGSYDEILFLDMVDFYFMEKLMDKNLNKIKIVSGDISQEFSGVNIQNSMTTQMTRFKIFKADFVSFCKIRKKSTVFMFLYLIKRFLSIVFRNLFIFR